MKILFIILGVLAYSNLNAQIEDYHDYMKGINQAELNLIRGNKVESLNKYYSTLTSAEGNYCKDIYNALLLSSELSRRDTFFTLLDLLIPKGLESTYIGHRFEKYQEYQEWKKFMENNKNQHNIDRSLRAKIDSLAIVDQKFRIKEGSYELYGDTINKIDSMNMEFLFELISLNRFPGENDIGVDAFAGGQGYDIVFHHYTQSTSLDKKKDKITPLLVNLVLQGKLLPNKVSHWLEMQDGEFTTGVFDVLNFSVNGKETGYFVPNYDKRKQIIINEYRKWLGMESLDEYYEKFLFKINNPKSKYIFDIERSTFVVDNEMLKKITANMKELK